MLEIITDVKHIMQSPKKFSLSAALTKIKRGSLGETFFLKIANKCKSCSLIAFRLLKKCQK